jgi:hypothetical protein
LAVLRSGEQVENILYIIYCCWVILYATAHVSGLMCRTVVLRFILPIRVAHPIVESAAPGGSWLLCLFVMFVWLIANSIVVVDFNCCCNVLSVRSIFPIFFRALCV